MKSIHGNYHKGEFRNGEWAKHLRPYLKRVGNKKWRKTGRSLEFEEETFIYRKKRKTRKTIKVKITNKVLGDLTMTWTSKYRTIRDAKNAMNRAGVVKSEILEN